MISDEKIASLNLDKIKNPKLKRVLEHRVKDFMFFYKDTHSDNHTDANCFHSDHREKYGDYDDYMRDSYT